MTKTARIRLQIDTSHLESALRVAAENAHKNPEFLKGFMDGACSDDLAKIVSHRDFGDDNSYTLKIVAGPQLLSLGHTLKGKSA